MTKRYPHEGPLCPDCGFKHREDNCPNWPALVCVEGNHPIPEGDQFYPEMRAYERPHLPGSGSGSSLVLREPTGRVACSKCVTRRLAGLSPLQEVLL